MKAHSRTWWAVASLAWFLFATVAFVLTTLFLSLAVQRLRHTSPREVWRAAREVAVRVRSESDAPPLGMALFGRELSPTGEEDVLLRRMGEVRGVADRRLGARRECRTECQCTVGGAVAGYGRFCGYHYSGCAGYGPCDAVDACCVAHDACVTTEGYTDCTCTTVLAKCMACTWFSEQSEPYAGNWTCSLSRQAAAVILADIMFLLPTCFDEAERAAIGTAADLSCRVL